MKRLVFVLVEDGKANSESAISAITEMAQVSVIVHRPDDNNRYAFSEDQAPAHVFWARSKSAADQISLCLKKQEIKPDYVLMDLNYPSAVSSNDEESLADMFPPKPFGFAMLFSFLALAPKGAVMVTSTENHGASMLPEGRHEINRIPVEFVADGNATKDWLTPLRKVWVD